MKKTLLILLALISAFMLLTSCGDEKSLKVDGDKLVDNESNVKYVMCSPSLQAVKIKGEVKNYDDTTLYEVDGLPTKEYLSENYDGANFLYRSESVEEPTLESFGAKEALVCIKGDTTIVNSKITDKAVVEAIITLMKDGKSTVEPAYAESSFELKFVSDKYPALYYRISAVRSSSGEVVLYDKGTRRCVSAGNIMDEYIK